MLKHEAGLLVKANANLGTELTFLKAWEMSLINHNVSRGIKINLKVIKIK